MDESIRERKQARLKQFLKMLSKDPGLLNPDERMESSSLSDFMKYADYRPRNEPIDVAELVSLLLKKKGFEAGSEDMMEYIVNGGTVDDFMKGRQL
ncbi:hypothetical protein [Cohnella terricola]|uniref:Uncharacterized protein n=1 Tax=Cohnella terricola TaxID=1289167 RepID=A0A559JN09_9BACL|nr:hypothetical protein [Cohnella terricola]TVY01261.1 hypothetical protein FPZ45_08925 [Cohnella terricola]